MSASLQAGAALPADTLAQIRDELRALYRELDQAVSLAGPVCQLSGRCCRFKEYDHTLYLSAPEALLLVADAPQPARGLDDGETCPWQDAAGRCTARDARPIGCRVFFCDPAFATAAPELSEAFLGRLKQLASQHAWSWDYAPLHRHLRQAQVEGRIEFAPTTSSNPPESSPQSDQRILFS